MFLILNGDNANIYLRALSSRLKGAAGKACIVRCWHTIKAQMMPVISIAP
jgi:hypothetical protein